MTDSHLVAERTARRAAGLRVNSFAALIITLLVFCAGISVTLFAKLPASDAGKNVFAAFGAALTAGPVTVAIHAVLGTLLVISSIAAAVRAVTTRRAGLIVTAGIALLAILAAWFSGAAFVGEQADGASLGMAISTAVGILCYSIILFITPPRNSADRQVA